MTEIFTNRLAVMPGHTDVPSRSDSKATWVEFAVGAGVDPAEATAMTRAELIEELGD